MKEENATKIFYVNVLNVTFWDFFLNIFMFRIFFNLQHRDFFRQSQDID